MGALAVGEKNDRKPSLIFRSGDRVPRRTHQQGRLSQWGKILLFKDTLDHIAGGNFLLVIK